MNGGESVFKNRIRAARKAARLSQEELAQKTGVSRQTICSLENGAFSPTARLALLLCEALEQPFEKLFYFEQTERQKESAMNEQNQQIETTYETEPKEVLCLLVGLDTGAYDCASSMAELRQLCETDKLTVAGSVVQKRSRPDGGTCVGEGKLEEIKEFAAANDVTLLVFDLELTAVQLRNIEKATDCAVLDRTMLILDIFAARARSAEGKLQVELAQQQYRLPRLMGMGTALSRLGGGIGTRGPGETKMETDRRAIRSRIGYLKAKLEELTDKREVNRRKREKNNLPVVALAGYTNAGKSTLLNRMTDADVFSEDMLFATLDPTARSLELPGGQSAILVDTVGFIDRLPHHLVNAFRSTLEEVVSGDVVLLVVDASDPESAREAEVSRKLLTELGCSPDKMITVLNKIDRLPEEERPAGNENTIPVSALTGFGLEALLEIIARRVNKGFTRMTVLLPYEATGLLAKVREKGAVFSESYESNGLKAEILVEDRYLPQLSPYQS